MACNHFAVWRIHVTANGGLHDAAEPPACRSVQALGRASVGDRRNGHNPIMTYNPSLSLSLPCEV
jgi:hypothetical protein